MRAPGTEALAKQHLSKDDSILGSMQNHSGHGIDIVAKNKTTGEIIVVEVKVNSSQLSDDQKKGANAFARDRVKRANAGEGPWASMSGRAKNVLQQLNTYLKMLGRKHIRGYVLRIEVDENGRARVVDKKPWKRCK